MDVGVLAKPILSAQLARFGRNYAIRMLCCGLLLSNGAHRLIFLLTLRALTKREHLVRRSHNGTNNAPPRTYAAPAILLLVSSQHNTLTYNKFNCRRT
jgi:hypothetical protein